jgi:tetratricopeptide (TPR) repeat protein
MRRTGSFMLIFLVAALFVFPQNNPWGHLKKIYAFNGVKNYDLVRDHLRSIHYEEIKWSEGEEISRKLVQFGDYYVEKGEYGLAEEFYKKVLSLSPDFWPVYNKLEKINREKGGVTFNFKYLLKQLLAIFANFVPSFLVVNHFFNILFFSGILVLFLFALILFGRYFKLAGHDLLMGEEGELSIKNLILVLVLLFWPAVILAGWMIYPFLIFGLLWTYLDGFERRAISFLIILSVCLSLIFAFNGVLEKSFQSEAFKKVEQVYEGKLFEKDIYETFDDELKVIQGLSYYEDGQYDRALEILNSTGEKFRSPLKFDLMGNIYFQFNNIDQSIRYYNESLSMNDKNPATLNNFTLALAKNSNEKIFDLYAQRYPEIRGYQKTVMDLKKVQLKEAFLWKRLFNFGQERFNLLEFLKRVAKEFVSLPVVYLILLMVVYIFLVKKIFPSVGESTYCSKCAKVIKEASIHRSYKLCSDCYQLFMIKDVVFLEAKVLKEQELNKRNVKKYIRTLLFSLFIPGLNLNFKNKNYMFVLFSWLFYFLLGLYIFSRIIFTEVFSTIPLFFNLAGLGALLLYVLINLYSLKGDENGI